MYTQQVDVYVDGSFNASTQTYGGGVVIVCPGLDVDPVLLSKTGTEEAYTSMRNVAGELLATMYAFVNINQLIESSPNVDFKVTIYYDYAGIECWFKGLWRANNPLTREYATCQSQLKFTPQFRKVKAHSGNEYNEMADQLAKKAVGLA